MTDKGGLAVRRQESGSEAKVADSGGDLARHDLVLLFANLVRTLEDALGGEALAKWLARLRQEGDAAPEPGGPAFERAFRRLGLLVPGEDVAESVRGMGAKIGAAVCRPASVILALFGLFVQGDAGAGLKGICGATPRCRFCRLTRECGYFNRPGRPEAARLSPAERLQAGNEAALSDAELLGLLLAGDKAAGGEEVVSALFSRYGGLGGVFRADSHEYSGLRGVGRTHALRLAAASALHRRLLSERREEPLCLASARDIHDRYAAEFNGAGAGAAMALLLDDGNRLIRDFRIEGAGIFRLAPADLLRPAVRENAKRIALVTNHPSGPASPSAAAADFTRRLRGACDLLGVCLVDHVIIAKSGYFSFAETGRLGI